MMKRKAKTVKITGPTPLNPTNKIEIDHGSEGPAHDLYAWTMISFQGRNGTTTLRTGLACWCDHNGVRIAVESHKQDDEQPHEAFERLTGLTPYQAEMIYHMRPYRRHALKCDGRNFHGASGYPGESFTICSKCGDVVDSHMNWSAIE